MAKGNRPRRSDPTGPFHRIYSCSACRPADAPEAHYSYEFIAWVNETKRVVKGMGRHGLEHKTFSGHKKQVKDIHATH